MRIQLHETIRQLGLKQKDVAHDTGIVEQRLCQIVNSAVNPTLIEIKKLCCYFDADEQDLFFPTNRPKVRRSRC